MVRAKGLEPSRDYPPEPKSGASANSATPAHCKECPSGHATAHDSKKSALRGVRERIHVTSPYRKARTAPHCSLFGAFGLCTSPTPCLRESSCIKCTFSRMVFAVERLMRPFSYISWIWSSSRKQRQPANLCGLVLDPRGRAYAAADSPETTKILFGFLPSRRSRLPCDSPGRSGTHAI